MRHIRDPITGYCIICEKNNIRHFVAPDELEGDSASIHGPGPDRPRSNGRGGSANGKKTIHVTSTSSNGSDPGGNKSSGKSTSLSRPSSSASLNSDDYNNGRGGTTTRSTSKLIIVERSGNYSPASSRRSPNRSPSPSLKSPRGKRGTSPARKGRFSSSDPESGCCGKVRCCKRKGNGNLSSKSRVFDESTNYNDGTDRCCGYRNSETASYGSGTWGIRRWCAPLLTLLVLGALAGMAAGIYFGVKAAKEKEAANQKVVSLLKNSQAVYIITGTDQRCVSAPVGRGTTTLFPYCSIITTKIIPANTKFVAPPDPDWVEAINQYSGGSEIRPLPIVGLLLLIWAVREMLVDRNVDYGSVDTS